MKNNYGVKNIQIKNDELLLKAKKIHEEKDFCLVNFDPDSGVSWIKEYDEEIRIC